MAQINTEKTITDLTKDSVSIKTQYFTELNGKMEQVGGNHRVAYANSVEGRIDLIENQPPHIVNSVLAIWGDAPTVSTNQETDNETSTDDSL